MSPIENLIKGTEFENLPLENHPQVSGGVFNNPRRCGTHVFLELHGAARWREPSGKLADSITKKWGAFAAFKDLFPRAQSELRFGLDLAREKGDGVDIVNTSNAAPHCDRR